MTKLGAGNSVRTINPQQPHFSIPVLTQSFDNRNGICDTLATKQKQHNPSQFLAIPRKEEVVYMIDCSSYLTKAVAPLLDTIR
jgi:hypothetical protein